MNLADAATLLGYLSGVDNRQPSEAAALAWHDALDDGITFEQAREAAAIHRNESTEYIQPAHVNAIVRRIQRERVQRAGTPPIPGGLTYEQEQAWRRLWIAAVKAAEPDPITSANRALGVTPPHEIDRPVVRAIEGQSRRWSA